MLPICLYYRSLFSVLLLLMMMMMLMLLVLVLVLELIIEAVDCCKVGVSRLVILMVVLMVELVMLGVVMVMLVARVCGVVDGLVLMMTRYKQLLLLLIEI